MKILLIALSLITTSAFSQTVYLKGAPENLESNKLIILKHEPVKITVDPKNSKEDKYIFHRQSNHNKVIKESNKKLTVEAMKYPYQYALATQSTYKSLAKAGYKYALISEVYKNNYLKKHPDEDVLIVFEYFIYDLNADLAYKVFELDEMKVYDSKLLIKKLRKAIDK